MKHLLAALLLAALCITAACGATAQGMTYVFPYEGFRYVQQDGETVLTQTNLNNYAALIASLGTTPDAMLASYIASGTVMEVLPAEGGQIAVGVADAGAFSDVQRAADLTAQRLEQFLAQFEDSGLYETCSLTTTSPVCARMTASAMRDGIPVYTLRYATLHLGRLYTLTKTVVGREPAQEDDEQIARVLGRMQLLSALAQPTSAPTLLPTPTPTPAPTPTPGPALLVAQAGEMTVEGVPSYTENAALAITGSAAPGATVRASVGTRTLAEAVCAADGSFLLAFTLPEVGDLTLDVATDSAQRSFAVHCDYPHIPLTITEPVETVFTGTNIVVRGQTAPGATVYVTGKRTGTNVQANNNGNFSARIFMNDPETLTFTLRAHLRGYQDTSVDITLTRVLTEREAIAEFRSGIISLSYSDFARRPANYAGKKFIFRGRISGFADYDGTPCALVMVSNVSTGVWGDPVWVVLDGAPDIAEGDIYTFYLEGLGTSLPADGVYAADGTPLEAPVARMAYMVE